MGSNSVDKNEGERKRQKGERGENRTKEREREKKNKKAVSLISKIYENRAVGFHRREK